MAVAVALLVADIVMAAEVAVAEAVVADAIRFLIGS